ncbi:F5/8 type C domain-containing protein [Catalinimonas alkaloidigena]|uniref:F5/8 type C domain-containing protein n=1 Tax=Catalinimonas alkaloidigena TaxID=1075417 RepID=A0A1G9ADE0_9BACT|nr:family 43 glycosylhydrolase [Catalinimonas alkaloidigena]SDK25263.1 F5/8 type C domain-containing protein [Catalinimonas alkaloidigena]
MKSFCSTPHISLSFCLLGLLTFSARAQGPAMPPTTYCNPLNLDYTYMIVNSHNNLSYRSGADPAVVRFRDEYYMFVTRSMGYWHSKDLTTWEFITPEKWYFQGSNAPAAHNYKDSVLYVTGDPSGIMSLLYTDNPKKGDWKSVPAILWNLQDPDFFIDDDGRAFMFWGSSNTYPIRGYELDPQQRFIPKTEPIEFFKLHEDQHGWERFGENHDHPTLAGYMEGAWLTKHNGRYYMQYAAPGTEWNTYADGVYVADDPLGPYEYAPNNPVSYKPGGFINGAGHGSTVEGPGGQLWHFGTIAISVNYNFERRLAMFPTFFDADGLMHANTSFGDYPHYAPSDPERQGEFRGWMLLSYKKPVTASSTLDTLDASHVTDERVKTFWVADGPTNDQWLQIDLEKAATVHALQLNYHDYQSNLYGRQDSLYHQYVIEGSLDGKTWTTLVDKSKNYTDVPNDYVELATPVRARLIRFRSLHVPTPHLALSGVRVFGLGSGKTPSKVRQLQAVRDQDRRNVQLTWKAQANAQGYNVRWGIAPDKLYSSWLVYDQHSLDLRSLNVDQTYYFAVEAFNENGVAPLSETVEAK